MTMRSIMQDPRYALRQPPNSPGVALKPHPVTFAAVAVMLATASFVAAWLPARRAAVVDPIQALRSE